MKFTPTKDGTEVSLVDKRVGYNYDSENNSVLAPSDSGILDIVVFIVMIAMGVLILALFLFVLTTFFKFLLGISRNEAFTRENVNHLRNMALSLFILSVFPLLANGIIYLIFICNYSSEGIQITYSFWKYDVYWLILAILSYIIYTAFKRAMILQEEQELTI